MPTSTKMPASPLAFLSEAYHTRAPSLFLITGSSNSGKTRWCERVIAYAREQQWTVAGLLSPSVITNGQKAGIDLLDLSSGERQRLAIHKTLWRNNENGALANGIVTGDWYFDSRVLAWGNGVLSRITKADLVIIDELGPLEFRQQQGLQSGLVLLDAWRYRLACVTIRSSLVGAARMRWSWSQVVVTEEIATPDN